MVVARAQRALVFGWLVLVVGWTWFWWPRSAPVAVAGLLVLFLVHAIFLAIEFCIAWRVAGRGVGARPPVMRFMRAWLAECVAAPLVFAWQQPFRRAAVPDHLPAARRRGVVLIHGFVGNRGFWNPWLRELREENRAFVAVDLEPVFGSIDRYVQTIEAAIARVTAATGLPPLLFCHSMGGLAARAWLRGSDGARVHRIVTIGTPHGGTWMARFGHSTNGREMRMGGEWMTRLESSAASARHARFTCFYSDCDNIVFPSSVTQLPGADNRAVPGRGHVELAFVRALRRDVLALIED